MHIGKLFTIDNANIHNYKLHLMSWNGYDQPLDLFAASGIEKDGALWEWNSYRGEGARDDFPRDYIFSMVQFYPEGKNTWLFTGIYKIVGRKDEGIGHGSYEIELCDEGKELIGRLKANLSRSKPQGRAYKLEKFWDDFTVSEILPEPYRGEKFPGYENIKLSFTELETLMKSSRPDWKSPLESVKGIYCITDTQNGKQYIGSAYGETGIWSRWNQYIHTGHGWNKNLHALSLNNAGEAVFEKGIDYAREHFQFSLLECFPFKIADNEVIGRENFWKDALLTRRHGYNAN